MTYEVILRGDKKELERLKNKVDSRQGKFAMAFATPNMETEWVKDDLKLTITARESVVDSALKFVGRKPEAWAKLAAEREIIHGKVGLEVLIKRGWYKGIEIVK